MSDSAFSYARYSRALRAAFVLATMVGTAAFSASQAVNFVANTDFTLSNVIFDDAGNLYGTTNTGGGSSNCHAVGCGTVFELSPKSGGGYTMTTLYSFNGDTDGVWPAGGLVRDSKGRLFGTASQGGVNFDCCGLIFMLTPTKSGWEETILYRFSGPDGLEPVSNLLLDAKGNLYGITYVGGASNLGTVFRLSPSGSSWKLTTLHTFTGTGDGGRPLGILFDAAGNIFGNTQYGRTTANPCGEVFELSFSGGSWREHTLHSFSGKSGDGCEPSSSFVFDGSGGFYGVASIGGIDNGGTVYHFSQSGGVWTESTLYRFTRGDDGGTPEALAKSPAGDLYGITNYGAPNGCDSIDGCSQVFKLTQSAGTWSVGAVYPTPNRRPSGAGLTFDSSGNLFGTVADFHYDSSGNVFEFTP